MTRVLLDLSSLTDNHVDIYGPGSVECGCYVASRCRLLQLDICVGLATVIAIRFILDMILGAVIVDILVVQRIVDLSNYGFVNDYELRPILPFSTDNSSYC